MASTRAKGFSLIEVLISVVVLATGLLSLASLQANLSRNSAEAKVRSQIASLLATRMDALRALGYNAIVSDLAAYNGTEECVSGAPADICSVLQESDLGSLSLTQSAEVFTSTVGGTSFSKDTGPADASKPQFVRIKLEAKWDDIAGAEHVLASVSELSELVWNSNVLPVKPDFSAPDVAGPVVRQDNPYEEGMIPIAIGGGSDTAATNPKPVIEGNDSAIAETSFNVLTYHNDDPTTVRVQQRVETRVVACKCEFGRASSDKFKILDRSYRPTYWNGSRYTVPKVAAYQSSEAVAWATADKQSDVCMQCCRDHHDPVSLEDDAPKFDPVRWNADKTEAQDRYLIGSPTTISTGVYNDACRVIRVDGMWRVASDAYATQVGYVATEEADIAASTLERAKSRVLDDDYSDKYKLFVVDYLKDRFVGISDGKTILERYASFQLDNPDEIGIKASNAAGESRYLHTRGLYVDYIEPEAQRRIDDAVENCIDATKKIQCAMPHIPFTSINLTQLAAMTTTDDGVITAETDIDDLGEINGFAGAPDGGSADAVARVKLSNTGLTGSLPIENLDTDSNPATVEGDAAYLEDAQKFTIFGAGTPSSKFTVNIEGLDVVLSDGLTAGDPSVDWQTTTGSTGCSKTFGGISPNPYTCRPDVTGVLANITLLVGGYNFQDEDYPEDITCINAQPDGGSALRLERSPTPRPVCRKYTVENVSVAGGSGTPGTPLAVDSGYNESFKIPLSLNLTSEPAVTVRFKLDSDVPATQGQCHYLPDPDGGYYVSSIEWSDECAEE